MNLESRLTHIVTQYDIKQSTRKGYNPYALGQYLALVDRICAAASGGVGLVQAIEDETTPGTLRTSLLKGASK